MTLNPDASRAAVRTFFQAWLPLLVLALTGWGHDITEWLGDTSRPFPAIPPIVKVLASLLPAVLAGLVSLVHNLLPYGQQAVYLPSTAVKGKPAQDEPGQSLIGFLMFIVACVVAVVCVVVVVRAVGS